MPRGGLRVLSDGDDRIGADIKTPRKCLDQNLTPKNSHSEFPSHKNVQKALNYIPQNIETLF